MLSGQSGRKLTWKGMIFIAAISRQQAASNPTFSSHYKTNQT